MKEVILILFSFLIVVQVLWAIVFLIRYLSRQRKLPIQEKEQKISIVIPFRNEAERIKPLLKSLNEQSTKQENYELIFVDDFSVDQTVKLITEHLEVPFLLLKNENKGKKGALDRGILQAKHPFILTLDADVSFKPSYLATLLLLSKADINVLPVKMTGRSLLQKIGLIEFEWLQLLTFASRKISLCNGANLLFKRDLYLATKQFREDFDIPSGDDIFLLDAAKTAGAQIMRLNHKNVIVETPAPSHFNTLNKQRGRWLNKMVDFKGDKFLPEGVIVIGLQFFTILSIMGLFIFEEPLLLLALLLLKVLVELGISFMLFQKEGPILNVIAILVHQIIYPIFLVHRIIGRYNRNLEGWR